MVWEFLYDTHFEATRNHLEYLGFSECFMSGNQGEKVSNIQFN